MNSPLRHSLALGLLLAAGTAYSEPVLSLSASSSASTAADVAVVRLQAIKATSDLEAGHRAVSQAVKNALDVLRSNGDISYRLENVTSRPRSAYKEDSNSYQWDVMAAIELKATDLSALAKAISGISPYLQVINYETQLSEKEKETLEGSLVKEVSASFHKKAFALTKAMGYKTYELKEVNYHFNSGGFSTNQPRVARTTALATQENTGLPYGEASTIVGTATISGNILLRP